MARTPSLRELRRDCPDNIGPRADRPSAASPATLWAGLWAGQARADRQSGRGIPLQAALGKGESRQAQSLELREAMYRRSIPANPRRLSGMGSDMGFRQAAMAIGQGMNKPRSGDGARRRG